MKISIDFDGTMWSHMKFFREFMRAMQGAGHQVGCLTGHNEDMRSADLDLMQKRGFTEPDFWFGRTPGYAHSAMFKAVTILRESIDIHFDDCDFGDTEALQIFQRELGDQLYRLVVVKDRKPASVHFE